MKKLFALAAIAASMSFAACSGSTNANTAEEDSISLENATPEAVVNSLAEKVQSGDATAITAAVETVQAELKSIIESGDVEKATAYASQIKAFVEENADKLKELNINTTTLADIVNAVKAAPQNAENAAEAAAEAVQADAEAAKDAAVEAGKAKANEVVEAGKAKANEAVEAGKAKTNEAIQNAADKLKL